MQAIFISALLTLLICGCASTSTAPENNKEFSETTNINDLIGIYNNQGDGGRTGSSQIYLSKILWPNDKNITHKFIHTINVTKINKTTLMVKALSNNLIIKEQLFIENEEFSITDGIIHLNTEIDIIGLNKEPAVGLGVSTESIGLDKDSHGKFRVSGSAAALVYLLVPVAIADTQEVRFLRIE